MSAHRELVPGPRPAGPGRTWRIGSVAHASEGLANETVLVELEPGHPGIVLRLPPLQPVFTRYDLSAQAAVHGALAAAGIPAPWPAVVVTDPQWIGTSFLVMPLVRGHVAGPAPVFDQWVMGAGAEAQRRMHDAAIDTMAAVHAVDWAAAGLASVLPGPGLDDALDEWAGYIEWAGAGCPLPALTEALEWCRRHAPLADPAGAPPVLLWGDPRLGNLIFDDHFGVQAVLDWDLAALGPREMDLGWYFGLNSMMDELFGQRVPGFPERAEAVERYEAASGHAVTDLAWHEVFALVRALAINDRQRRVAAESRDESGRGRTGPARDDPLVRILRARMESAG